MYKREYAFGARDLSIKATYSASSSPRVVAPYMWGFSVWDLMDGTRLETTRITKGNGKRVILNKAVTRSRKFVGHSYINGSSKGVGGWMGAWRRKASKSRQEAPLPLLSCSWQMLHISRCCALTLGIFTHVVSSNGLISRCAVWAWAMSVVSSETRTDV